MNSEYPPHIKTVVPPLEKKCRVCKVKKLLNEFQINERIKDRHDTVCKSCTEEAEDEEHTQDCITNKFFDAVFEQLSCLLALSENHVEIPDEILGLVYEIIEQDERNKGIQDDKGRKTEG